MAELMPLYKVLVDGKSAHGGDLVWSLPRQRADGTWRPGRWHHVAGEIAVCDNGLHLTMEPVRWLKLGAEVYAAEGAGASDAAGDKIAYRRARLTRPAPEQIPAWWPVVEHFCREEIPTTPWFRPDGAPDPAWRLFTAPTWDAAGDAARDAARGAARDAAWDAAWDAAGGAALYAQCCLLCADLPLAEEHKAHAHARWAVWRAGYALLGDVNGTLYVYGVER